MWKLKGILALAGLMIVGSAIGLALRSDAPIERPLQNYSSQSQSTPTTGTTQDSTAPVSQETAPISQSQETPAPQPQVKQSCPAGSYEIGRENNQPICKQEPTGCPYGDSIPVDSPKCAPPKEY